MAEKIPPPKSPKEILALPENKVFLSRMEKYNDKIKEHKFLDEDSINEELSQLNLSLNASLDVNKDNLLAYSSVMNKIISYKERIAYLCNRGFADHKVVSGAYNNLYKQWIGVFSNQKSQDRREGEANYLLSSLHDMMITREVIYENLRRIAFNLSSEADMISRKITLIQLNANLSKDNDE